MKPTAAALSNWFLPGLGYLILGTKIPLAIAWMVSLVGLTYVEFGIKEAAPEFYLPMFASVLVMNTAFAVDAWKTAKEA
ncbi:MAG: hypothetical protein GY898_32060 [Proteobacteria bacterium]|nr:hypothetical protein [Pseudomonadota bacterium]